MPELPDVELARRFIEERALGRRIASVDDSDVWVCRPHAPGELAVALTGASLTNAHRHGKTMWIETDTGPVLGLHLGMTGGIRVDESPTRRDGTGSRSSSRTVAAWRCGTCAGWGAPCSIPTSRP